MHGDTLRVTELPPIPASICVPVRDEEAALPLLLASLAAQRVEGVELVACFFLDGCTDGSAAVLRQAGTRFPYPLHIGVGPRTAVANAGRARRAALAMGLEGPARNGLLLTTDADSVPAHDWARAAVKALTLADVTIGSLVRSESHAMQTRVEAYYDRLYRYRRTIDPVEWENSEGRHFGGGANLAIRASIYRALGGFAELAAGEDTALLDDASRAGFRVRHDPAMIVETSSRREGRASGGLATALAQLDRTGPPKVTHPADAAWQYMAQAQARAAFSHLETAAERERLGTLLGLSGDHVLGVRRDCPNAEAFAMRIVPAAPNPIGRVSLAQAEEALTSLELAICERAA